MGPWSRSFIAAVAGRAERPELEVTNLRIDPTTIRAQVEGCGVTLTASPISPRMWSSMARYAEGMGQLEEAVEGRIQSVHLEHLLEEDWDEQLIPRTRAITQTCECDEDPPCDHTAAVAHAVADEIERSPRTLLRWRGVAGTADTERDESTDPWQGRGLNVPPAPRPMPTYAVLKRLGPSRLPVAGDDDLANALRVAYETVVSRTTDNPISQEASDAVDRGQAV
jgi:hypothetical protein